MEAKAAMTERSINLVVPLPHKGTDMRSTETAGSAPARSGAVTPAMIRQGDVASTTGILPTRPTPGIRTSTTATRTTTTRTTSSALAPSADWNAPADFSFEELAQAYFDCRRTKRNSASALAFEARLERNLRNLFDELQAGTLVERCSIPQLQENFYAITMRRRFAHPVLQKMLAAG